MALIFMDSSAVVKRYVQETGSVWVGILFIAVPVNEITIVSITGVEVVAAITRRVRGGTITPADAASSCALFLADLGADYQAIAVTDVLLSQAIRLAQLHSLRGYDVVHLAAANEVNRLSVTAGTAPILFVSADQELNAAARSEGLAVDDPNAHP
jgi:predicted nucleic acid-binding protein